MRPLRAAAPHLHLVPDLNHHTIKSLLNAAPGKVLTYAQIRAALPEYRSNDVTKVLVMMRRKGWVVFNDNWTQLDQMRVSLPLAA